MKTERDGDETVVLAVDRNNCLANVDAVLFDWDGVLVDSSRNYFRAYELILQEVGISTTPREIYLREGQPTPQVIAAICADRGVAISDAQISALVQRRREHDRALGPRTFYPGMLSLIQHLRDSGRKLAMVTGSSRKSVEAVLTPEEAGHFDVIVTADDVSRPKPHPEPFLRAAEKLQVKPCGCLVVENAPFGVMAARAAGSRVIAICSTLPSEDLCDADWIVNSHEDLQTLLMPN
ncbi:MAG TPA: HAD family phosphatase [Terriglobales bacterium]|nr:HAD family phosphatase [Terriglobales bacterium]